MNPATLKADILNLEVPEISKTTDVNSAATSIAKLENIEKNIYQVLLAQYNYKIFTYRKCLSCKIFALSYRRQSFKFISVTSSIQITSTKC